MQKAHANWHNPLSQITIRITEKMIRPLRAIIPGFKGIDYSIIVAAIIIQMIEQTTIFWISQQQFPQFIGLSLLSIASVLYTLKYLIFFIVIISALSSWFTHPSQANPFIQIIDQIANPIFQPVRKRMPIMKGIDFSAIVIIIGLQLIEILVISPLYQFGLQQLHH